MAELRTEIADMSTRIDTGILALKREALAMRAILDGLRKRAEDEIAGDYELQKLDAIEPRVAAIEQALEQADTGPAAASHKKGTAASSTSTSTHAKSEHK